MNKPIDGQDAYPEPVTAEFVRPATVKAQMEMEQLRAECSRWRERAIRAMRDRNAAQKEANKYAADLMEANGELAKFDAARESRARLVQLWQARGISARASARRSKDVESVSRWRLDSFSVLVAVAVLLLVLLALGIK